jgi:hypothetical protein
LKTQFLLVFKFTVCLVVVTLFASCFVPVGFAVSSNEANDGLRSAQTDLDSAFLFVAQAQRAGANVSALLNKLNEADGFLSEGYVAFRSGDYESAFYSAAKCSASIEGVAESAGLLKASAERAENDKILLNAVATGVGLVMLFVFGFLGWGVLRRWLSGRVLKLRPLVEESQ